MKAIVIFFLFFLFACGPESSPEGRSKIRIDKLQDQVDSLKHQNQAIMDTLKQIHQEIKKLNSNPG